MFRRFAFLLIAFFLLQAPCMARETIVLASVEWPPYVGNSLHSGGISAQVVRAAFEAVDIDVDIRYFPWSRTLYEAHNNPEIMGYFPEYPDPERVNTYFFSDSIGRSPLGFAKRRARAIRWYSVLDWKKFVFATVRGYANSPVFDEMVAKNEIVVDESVSDIFVLRKVLAGRVDYGVIDSNVFTYLMSKDPFLHARRGELKMDPHLLAILHLHVAFKRTDDGERIRNLFNKGLQSVSPLSIQQEYLQKYLSH
ncbi:transporter substrate-binding domain-containing protein [Pseudodesulfovibrio sp. zrk46]|uniref:substrate-binding periplasmic protein n=1 Tax=Pseudodesulfovibrio sp. zrk46 TaxID=2725288 RepID=UPI00144967B8|nr:transporter substrate-binding domain-containing protein [Pseudodesulfovibrio sp. zrk46]QJB55036.1 transporter substrate-binding domain-containing protein [Pseudodesulfovibrio sp. zrk46]